MKTLAQVINEARSPHGIRGYVALVEINSQQEIIKIPYEETPEQAIENYQKMPKRKFTKVIEGPYLMTVKGDKWYWKEYQHIDMYYGDNGFIGGNYELDEIPVEEAWKIITDPKNKYIKK